MNRQDISRVRYPPAQESSGFTLIELLITIVILSILAAIAIPSYQSYVLKSHRTEAKTTLLDLASMEERFFSTSNLYSTLPSDLGYGAPAFPFNSFSGYYQISIAITAAVAPSALAPAGTPATYTLTATALAPQVNDTNCQVFTLLSNGTKTATPDPNNNCWN
ncbi:MAG: type IV pilin protein [Steroidobacteraceae bacterium]|jgi:type IV pilus assembly protein PilE